MARYEFHAITRADFKELANSGLFLKEIDYMNNLKSPSGDYQKIDIHDEFWGDWIKSRTKFIRKARKKGWSPQKIRARLKRKYDKSDKGFAKTFMDFVREQYKKGLQKSQDYDSALKSRKSEKAGSRANPKGR